MQGGSEYIFLATLGPNKVRTQSLKCGTAITGLRFAVCGIVKCMVAGLGKICGISHKIWYHNSYSALLVVEHNRSAAITADA
jgi:tetrahydromethanopterin S-methyltransferase subunit C